MTIIALRLLAGANGKPARSVLVERSRAMRHRSAQVVPFASYIIAETAEIVMATVRLATHSLETRRVTSGSKAQDGAAIASLVAAATCRALDPCANSGNRKCRHQQAGRFRVPKLSTSETGAHLTARHSAPRPCYHKTALCIRDASHRGALGRGLHQRICLELFSQGDRHMKNCRSC